MKNLMAFLFFIIVLQIEAFTLNYPGRVAFSDNDVKVVIASNICSAAGFNSAEELRAMVEESLDEYWNRVPTCALKLEVTGVNSSIDTSGDSLSNAINKVPQVNQILVGCADSGFEATTLGVANITSNGAYGALLLNNSSSVFANLSEQEKKATIAHDIGHAFGLGHSSNDAALMYFSIGGKVQERLTIDDYDGCSYLYPHDSPGSCSAAPIGPGSVGKNHFDRKSMDDKEVAPFLKRVTRIMREPFFLMTCALFFTVLIGSPLRKIKF